MTASQSARVEERYFDFSPAALCTELLAVGKQHTVDGYEPTCLIFRNGEGCIYVAYEDNYDPIGEVTFEG